MTETHTHEDTRVDGRMEEGQGRVSVRWSRAHRSHNRSYYLVLRRSMHFINFCHGRMSARPRVAAANLHD